MSDEKVKFDEVDKMHVIRRLKEVIGKWWSIQINFTDKRGFLRGVPEGKFFNPLNPICQTIVADKKGFEKRVATARKTTVDSMNVKRPQLTRCSSGFSVISVPIHVDNEFMGTVFGDGFITEDIDERHASVLNPCVKSRFQRSMFLCTAMGQTWLKCFWMRRIWFVHSW